MKYKNFRAKEDDGFWLFNQIRNKLVNKVIINNLVCNEGIVNGRYLLKGYDNGIDFHISYSKEEFIRVSVGTSCTWAKYEDKVFVLNEIKNVISATIRDVVLLGEPTVFYNISQGIYKTPNLEYIYDDKENYIKSFQDKTIFGGIIIPEDVIVFDSVKDSKEFGVAKSYSYIMPDTQSRYSIGIYAMLKNRSDIEEKELRNVMIENLDELFNKFNESLLDSYVTYNNDITYITSYIKNALSLVEEVELCIDIKRNGKEIHNIRYINGHLVKYESNSKLFEYNFNTIYDIRDGIKFDTNCALKASEIIIKGVQEELQKINNLRNINNKCNVKSNDNLLKLVRRIGNK